MKCNNRLKKCINFCSGTACAVTCKQVGVFAKVKEVESIFDIYSLQVFIYQIYVCYLVVRGSIIFNLNARRCKIWETLRQLVKFRQQLKIYHCETIWYYLILDFLKFAFKDVFLYITSVYTYRLLNSPFSNKTFINVLSSVQIFLASFVETNIEAVLLLRYCFFNSDLILLFL